MEQTFTNVFYEKTEAAAKRRLTKLRETDHYPEIKAYIIQEDDDSWRVLRKIRITFQQPKDPVEACRQKLEQLKSAKRKRR